MAIKKIDNTIRSDTSSKLRAKESKKKETKIKDTEEYKAYQKHLKSAEFKETRRIVIERDKSCCFCGRTEDELELSNGKKLTFQVHHIPVGYKHLYDPPEIEAQYCRLFCSACHSAAHKAPSNRNRFTAQFTKKE